LDGTFNCVTTPLNAIVQKNVKTLYTMGCDIDSNNTSGFTEAVELAKVGVP